MIILRKSNLVGHGLPRLTNYLTLKCLCTPLYCCSREKVGQTIRDALHFQYRSSTKAKKKRRQVEQAKASANMNQISMSHFEISSKINDLKDKVTETSKCTASIA